MTLAAISLLNLIGARGKMRINVNETIVDKACIEFVANHIARYGEDPSTWSTWQAALNSVVPVQQTTNIDYTAALEAELRDLKLARFIDINEGSFNEVATRLNSAIKTSQNCA